MNTPFFSIIIPTRNRPDYVHDCIASVLKQSFDNYEIIVSDNGTDRLCKDTVDRFCDRRIIYKKTPKELGLCDNFEFAQNGFRGDYFIVLGDKHRLYRDALQKVYDVITKSNAQIVTFKEMSFSKLQSGDRENIHTGYIKNIQGSGKVKVISPGYILKENMDYVTPFGSSMGLIYGAAFFSKELADKLKEINGNGRLFGGVIPDRYSSFIAVGLVDKVYYIDEPLSLYINNGTHTSEAAHKSLSSLEEQMKNSDTRLDIQEWERYMPLKNCYGLVENLMAADFGYALSQLTRGGRADNSIDTDSLQINKANFIEKSEAELRGASEEDPVLCVYKKAIKDYCAALNEKEKTELKKNISDRERDKPRIRFLTRSISMISGFLLSGRYDRNHWKYEVCNKLDKRHIYIEDLVSYL